MKKLLILSLLAIGSYMGASQHDLVIDALVQDDVIGVLKSLNSDAGMIQRTRNDLHGLQLFHYSLGNPETAELLIMRGAGVDTETTTDWRTPLMMATFAHNKDVAQLLIRHKASVNQADKSGSTALHGAVESENGEIAELLVHNKAAVDIADSRGQTPLHHAIKEGRVNTTRLLLEHKASVHIRDQGGVTPLEQECQYGSEEEQKQIRELLEPYKA